jgi:hypothetical protein
MVMSLGWAMVMLVEMAAPVTDNGDWKHGGCSDNDHHSTLC